MKVELKQIIDQLTEAIGLEPPKKVAAVLDDNANIIGWTIREVAEDGTLIPVKCNGLKDCSYYQTLKDLFEYNYNYEKIVQ